MNWKERLKNNAESAHNMELEDSMNERDGFPVIPCLRLSEIESFIESLLKKQREIDFNVYMENKDFDDQQIASAMLNAPEPEWSEK